MTSILRAGHVRPIRGVKTPSRTINRRTTFILRRILDSLSARHQMQKDREIGRLIARSGGRITDELERRIIERAMRSDWNAHW